MGVVVLSEETRSVIVSLCIYGIYGYLPLTYT